MRKERNKEEKKNGNFILLNDGRSIYKRYIKKIEGLFNTCGRY